MQPGTPHILEYAHDRGSSRGRAMLALALRGAGGLAAGAAIWHLWGNLWLVLIGYSFGCTLGMSLLAGRWPLVVAATACSTVSLGPVAMDLLTHGNGDPSFAASDTVGPFVALFTVSAISSLAAVLVCVLANRERGAA